MSESQSHLIPTTSSPSAPLLQPSRKPRHGRLFQLYAKWLAPKLPETHLDLRGRNVIVTGSNVGLGFEAAKSFYGMRPKTLILAVRNVEKGEEARKLILDWAVQLEKKKRRGGWLGWLWPGFWFKKEKDNTKVDSNDSDDSAKVDLQVWPLDLTSFDSVKRFGDRASRELDRLDILVENAGVLSIPWTLTKDGWENTLQTNVISTFMLATLLVPLLLKTAKLPAPVENVHLKPHLVVLTSSLHSFAAFPQKSQPEIFKALNDKDQYIPMDRYRTTKLLDVVLTRKLSQVVRAQQSTTASNTNEDDEPIVMCSVDPGLCKSQLGRSFAPTLRILMSTLVARPTAEGAKNIVWASLTNNIPGGAYISWCQNTILDGYSANHESIATQEKLWNELGEIITPVAPETKELWSA